MDHFWHINYHDNNYVQSILLWPMQANKHWFRVTQAGIYPSILVNINYSLIHKKYKGIFEGLESQVECYQAKIIDQVLKTESDDYIGLNIYNSISIINIDNLDKNGLKIWTYSGHVFVSDDLKDKIEAMKENDLYFNLGFSNFAA